MKELEITVRARNNRLKERRLAQGCTQIQMCKRIGVSLQMYASLETLRHSPLGKTGQWRPVVRRIAEFYEVDPEDLFPNAVLALSESIHPPVAVEKLDVEEFARLSAPAKPPMIEGPDKDYDRQELQLAVQVALSCLSERDELIAKLKYGLCGYEEHETSEIAEILGVTTQVIYDRLRKITRTLRHGSLRSEIQRGWHNRSGRRICRSESVGSVPMANPLRAWGDE